MPVRCTFQGVRVARILIVDDETSMQEFLEILLQREGHDVVACGSAEQAILAIEGDEFDLVISDLRMPGMSGLELLEHIQDNAPETTVILITAHGTTESAIEAMRYGAYDYLTKPCSIDEIRLVVSKALEKRELCSENERLRRQIREQTSLPSVVGRSRQMQDVFALVRQVAPSKTNVLITGESGTGKELVARAVHKLSDRKDNAYVAINCGAIPENLLESELFGHMRGSFTGATSDKQGLFEIADKGTLFLDEIGEMPLNLQVKLLRAIQERIFRRVGGTNDIRVNVRIVCSTNRSLENEVREGRFREDLFYRLNVIEVELPALRDRPEDVAQLIHSFVQRFANEQDKRVTGLSAEAIEILEGYAFPGNVRELENIIERAVTLARSEEIGTEQLPGTVFSESQNPLVRAIPEEGMDLEETLAQYEASLIRAALERTDGVKKRAAALLGVSFRSFRYRLEKLGLE
ncbi:MAG: sigma-54-dependent Fis family transcriptional regulator [bacterium]|nr:sigma-54-dependent Fis family transcriptional regulator [bacterium]